MPELTSRRECSGGEPPPPIGNAPASGCSVVAQRSDARMAAFGRGAQFGRLRPMAHSCRRATLRLTVRLTHMRTFRSGAALLESGRWFIKIADVFRAWRFNISTARGGRNEAQASQTDPTSGFDVHHRGRSGVYNGDHEATRWRTSTS